MNLIADDSNDHHKIRQSWLYINALWLDNWWIICFLYMCHIFLFLMLAGSLIFRTLESKFLEVNATFSLIKLLIEIIKMYSGGKKYFCRPWSYVDVLGNLAIVITGYFRKKHGIMLYNSPLRKGLIVFGLICIGFKAVSTLRIFKFFRGLIENIISVLIDVIPFTLILILIV